MSQSQADTQGLSPRPPSPGTSPKPLSPGKSPKISSPGRSPRQPSPGQGQSPYNAASPAGQGLQLPTAAEEAALEDAEDDGYFDDNSSTLSTTSIWSEIREYREINGRTYQASHTTEYWGPNDDHQNEGLDIIHHCITRLLGDQLFTAPLTSPSRVLDVGCGTGIWAIDVADQHPEAEVIGLDISPIQPGWTPPNCKFHIDDAQLDWTYEPASFDFIHLRCMYGSISDWPRLYKEVFTALQPGGYIENFEMTIRLMSDEPGINDDPNHIFNQWADVFLEAFDRIGKTGRIGEDGRMKKYMEEAGFVDVVVTEYKLPVGGWNRDPLLRQVGYFNLEFMDQSLEGFALFLLQQVMGWEYPRIIVFVAHMRKAIKNPKSKAYYPVLNVHARKPLSSTAAPGDTGI